MKVTVGRSHSDDMNLMLSDDITCSRIHAIINCSDRGIAIEDVSKYGVFLNNGISSNKRIGSGHEVKLEVGDVVRFGRMKSIFQVGKYSKNARVSLNTIMVACRCIYCTICMEYRLSTSEKWRASVCGHTFHEECLKSAMNVCGFQCPVCKKRFLRSSVHDLFFVAPNNQSQ